MWKRKKSTVTAAALAIGAFSLFGLARSSAKSGDPAPEASSAGAVAVVELFTSEGCSSCPPADALISKLAGEFNGNGRRVLALAFHVDYWDHLGWKDPYGSAENSARQQAYSRAFGLDSVYTPQMVVNGSAEFVGSDRSKALVAIGEALKSEPKTKVSVKIEPGKTAGDVVVRYSAAPAAPGSVINIAVVERNLVSSVSRGENSGQTLRHYNVVRSFATRNLEASGTGELILTIPKFVLPANAWAVAYVQNPQTKAVLGGAAVDLLPAKTAR